MRILVVQSIALALLAWYAHGRDHYISGSVLDLSETYEPGTVLTNAAVVPGGALLPKVTYLDGDEVLLKCEKWERETNEVTVRLQRPPPRFYTWVGHGQDQADKDFKPQKKWVRTTHYIVDGFAWRWMASGGDVVGAKIVISDIEVEWDFHQESSSDDQGITVSWWRPVATNDVKGKWFINDGRDGYWFEPSNTWTNGYLTNVGLTIRNMWVTNVSMAYTITNNYLESSTNDAGHGTETSGRPQRNGTKGPDSALRAPAKKHGWWPW